MVTDGGSQASDTPAETFDYAMVDRRVSTDPRLKPIDVRIYNVMAGCRVGNRVKMGMRLIAKGSCTSLGKVGPALNRLADCGYIEIVQQEPRGRSEYRLTFWRFGAAQATEEPPAPKVDKSAWPCCPECNERRPKLLKVGWCRSCDWERKVGRVADRRIERRMSLEKTA